MGFEVGNKYGHRFTNDQPSPEAKRRGRAKAKLMRETMRDLLRAIEPDDQAAAAVMLFLPKKDREKVTTQDVICLRQILEAKKGKSDAFQNIIKTLGESTEKVEVTGKGGKDLITKYEVEIIDSRSQVERKKDE